MNEKARVPFLDLRRQYEAIQEAVDAAIAQVLDSTEFVGGAATSAFEQEFAQYVDASGCVGVGNGTDAIEIALDALGLEVGSEVIVPANSFIATSEAVSRSGHRVVFADVDPSSYTLDPADVRSRITTRTRAIIAVHLYGNAAPLDDLLDICEAHGLALIEDSAQAHGAKWKGTTVGSFGDFGTFSFYPGKNLGAYGDAGAIVSNNEALLHRARMIADHGREDKYDHRLEGRNSRLDSLQAAVLRVKLGYLEEWTERRREIAQIYRDGLSGVGDLVLPKEAPGSRHVFHLFVVRTESRDQLRKRLREEGVSTGIHYPIALPRLQAYADHPQHEEPFRAVDMANELLSLPIGDSLTTEEILRVCEVIRAFFR